MTDRERLTELLKADLEYFSNDIKYWHDEHIGALVDHLLANGVVVGVVRRKGCKHFEPRAEIEGVSWTGFCNYGEFHTDEEDFCSRGERRSEDEIYSECLLWKGQPGAA